MAVVDFEIAQACIVLEGTDDNVDNRYQDKRADAEQEQLVAHIAKPDVGADFMDACSQLPNREKAEDDSRCSKSHNALVLCFAQITHNPEPPVLSDQYGAREFIKVYVVKGSGQFDRNR